VSADGGDAEIARLAAIRRAHQMDQDQAAMLQPEIAAAQRTGDDAVLTVSQANARAAARDAQAADLQAQITALTQLLVQGLDANAQNDAATAQQIREQFAAADAQVRVEFQALLDDVATHFAAQLAILQDELDEPEYVMGPVLTLPAGATPTVTVEGSERPYRLTFGIPQGAKGETGATGTAGATGATGAAGAAGLVRLGLGFGRLGVALLVGASAVDVTVTLSRTMLNTAYNIELPPQYGFVFGAPKGKTTTSFVVPVSPAAGLGLSLGATFIAEAWQ
jgi:hypothetical protein